MYLLTAPPHLPAEPLHLLQLHDGTEHRTNLNKQPSFGYLGSNVPLSTRQVFQRRSASAVQQLKISAPSSIHLYLVAFPSPLTHSSVDSY